MLEGKAENYWPLQQAASPLLMSPCNHIPYSQGLWSVFPHCLLESCSNNPCLSLWLPRGLQQRAWQLLSFVSL